MDGGSSSDPDLDALMASFSGLLAPPASSSTPSKQPPPRQPTTPPPAPLPSPLPLRSPSLITPGLLKPLRPYQCCIVREVQQLYLRLQAAPASARARPSAALDCSSSSSSSQPTAIHPATAAGCAAALQQPPLPSPALPGSALLYLPTGGGKTRVAGELARWLVRCGGRVLFVVNRTKLVGQAAAAFTELGLGQQLCVWGDRQALALEHRPLHIATVQALAARERRGAAGGGGGGGGDGSAAQATLLYDLLILDEAHGSVSASYQPLWAAARTGASASKAPLPALKAAAAADPSPSSSSSSTASNSTSTPPLTHARPFVLGLTATPVRHGDTATLGRYFDVMLLGPSLTALVAAGVLVQPVPVSCQVEELAAALKAAGVERGGGGGSAGSSASGRAPSSGSHLLRVPGQGEEEEEDEEEGEESEASTAQAAEALERALLKSSDALQAIVRAWKQKCSNCSSGSSPTSSPLPPRPTIVFAPTVAASSAIAAAFCSAGIPAAHVDGTLPAATREAIYARMASGALTLLSSVGVVSEGYDEPSISAVLLLRPTASRGLYVQQVGRGLRGHPSKRTCLVLDFVQATLRHGPVTRPLLQQEEGGEAGSGAAGSGAAAAESDESVAARAAVAARIRAARAAGTYAALPPFPVLLRQEAARARAAALKAGGGRVWTCAALGCSVLNHGAVAVCLGCGGRRAPRVQSTLEGGKVGQGQGQGQGGAAAKAGGGGGSGGGGLTAMQQFLLRVKVPLKQVEEEEVVVVGGGQGGGGGGGGGAAAEQLTAGLAALSLDKPKQQQQQPVKQLKPAAAAAAAAAATASAHPPPPAAAAAAPLSPSQVLESEAFRAACAKLSLPPFTLAMAASSWERDFLTSLAAFVTPGVPHAYKSSAGLEGKRPSDKQREILGRIVRRGGGGGSSAGAGAGGRGGGGGGL